MGRYISFLIVVIIGIALGLTFAWVVAAPDVGDTSLDTLRQDYKSDYVLMIAEVYASDGNFDQAVERLGVFAASTPLQLVDEAVDFASQNSYTADDILLMRELSVALQSYSIEATP